MQGGDDHYGTVRQIEIAREKCTCPLEVSLIAGAAHSPQREAAAETLAIIVDFAKRVLALHGETASGGQTRRVVHKKADISRLP